MLGRDRDSGCPICDHNRTSPRFEIEGILFPMLTLSEAEHGAYHNVNVSDAHNPQRIYDTLWMQVYPVAPRRDPTADVAGGGILPPIPGRTKARPYGRRLRRGYWVIGLHPVPDIRTG